MAADNFSATFTFTYTPPNAPVNSGVASLAVSGTYQGGQAGSVDVPPGTTVGTVLSIPFGSVAAAKVLVIRNNMSSEVGIRLNGSGSNNFNIPAGGQIVYLVPTTPVAVPLTAASIITIVDPTAIERVNFWVFGD